MLIAYSVSPTTGPLPRDAMERIFPAGSTCFNPAPAVRSRVFPDFKSIPQRPGTRSWTMIGFDIDAKGRPVRVHIVATAGNAGLDRAATVAVGQSRFEARARSGCLYPYWRTGEPLAAPPIPDTVAQNSADVCPAEKEWDRSPTLSYPDAERRHGIEGWAIIGYDVAPWGATGNVRALASEPSGAFGDAGVRMIIGARKPASSHGYTHCVSRVRFVIGRAGEPGPSDTPPPPF